MPVKHDLLQDLKLSKEEVAQRRTTDPRLDSLLNDYQEIDQQVLDAEASAAPDDRLKKLKEKRLLTKDRIVQQIEYPGTRGAAEQF